MREKLKAIRDSAHPAGPWALNVIQGMDELKQRPDDADTLRALGKNVAMFEKAMGDQNRVEHVAGRIGSTPTLTDDSPARRSRRSQRARRNGEGP